MLETIQKHGHRLLNSVSGIDMTEKHLVLSAILNGKHTEEDVKDYLWKSHGYFVHSINFQLVVSQLYKEVCNELLTQRPKKSGIQA